MIVRQFIPGALYGDHLPSGHFVATIPHIGIVTHAEPIVFPPGESFGLGFVRCTDVGGFRFAGQAHDTLDPACLEWISEPVFGSPVWKSHPPPCCGVSPLIYNRDGLLVRSNCGPGVGSQGYRYVNADNVIVTGDATYGPFNGLFEYTDLGDGLWIGQAAYDGGGVQVWDGTLRQLEPGDCRFVRANRDGENVALAFTKPEGVVLIACTMADLRALPVVVPPAHPVPVPPTPEEPVTMRLPDVAQAIVEALYQRNKTLAQGDDDQRRELARLIAETVRFALGPAWGWKSAGGGRPPSKDSIAMQDGAKLLGFDLFNGATREPNDHPESTDITGQTFIAVPAVDHLRSDTPAPPPTPDLTARVAALEQAVEALTARLDALPPPVAPDVTVAVQAALSAYEATGSTGRTLAHSHSVRLNLTRRP